MKVRKITLIHVTKKAFDVRSCTFYQINRSLVSGKKVISITIRTSWMYNWLDPKRN